LNSGAAAPGLGRWGAQVSPDTRSFLDIVNGPRAPWRSAPDPAVRGGRQFAAGARAFVFSRPWVVTLCVAILGFCAAIYGTLGYVDDKRIAGVERAAADHVLRANADLQRQPDRAPEASLAAAARNDTTPDATPEATPQLRASQPAAIDGAAPLIGALGHADLRLADPPAANATALLRWDAAGRAGLYVEQLSAPLSAGETQEKLDRLSADYAELVGERDQLRERVRQLEQALSLLEPPPAPQGPPQPASAAPDTSIGAGSAKTGAAVIAFPDRAAARPAADQSRLVNKNFTPPGSVPNYFSDESGAILGSHGAAATR
jgi:hypothetical protein